MKKIAALFLLTIFVGSFAFAIEGIGDFTAALDIGVSDLANNSAKREKGKAPLEIDIEPSITYFRAFGAVGLEAGLGNVLGIGLIDADLKPDSTISDDLYLWVKPSYSLAAGPGTLGFDLKIKPTFHLVNKYNGDPDGPSFAIDPHVGYGMDAGFGTLGFDLGTDSLVIYEGGGGLNDKFEPQYGLGFIPIYFKAGIELPIGFNAYLKPVFGIATNDESTVGPHKSEFSSIVIGLGYQIIDIVRADLDVTIPVGNEDNGTSLKYAGMTIAPKVTAAFDAIGAYLGAEISRIGAELPDDHTIGFKLTLGASYSF
jgi:hypothetical protein